MSRRMVMKALNALGLAACAGVMVTVGASDLPRIGLALINCLPFAAALAVDSHRASAGHRRLARVVNGLWAVMGAGYAWIAGVEPGGQTNFALVGLATALICGANVMALGRPVPAPPSRAEVERRAALRGRREPVIAGAVLGLGLLSLTPIAWLILGSLVVFCLALGLPILGTINAFELSAWLGCSLEGFGSACELRGFWVDRLAIYKIPIVNVVGTPALFLWAFWDVVLGWLLLGLTVLAIAHTVRGEGA